MSNVINAVPRFARRTAEAAINMWDRTRTVECMKLMGKSYEQEVVKQIEEIQKELVSGQRDE
nr:MAG TPA_asm: hypothetical protein [Caudoviricetes sp.]